jgi:hypothetical protein
MPDRSNQALGGTATRHDADRNLRQTKLSSLGGDDNVGVQCQLAPAPKRRPGNGRDNGL